MRIILSIVLMLFVLAACSKHNPDRVDKKGFQVNEIRENEEGEKVVGLPLDSLQLETQPRGVLLTKHPKHRLSPIYKINYDRRTGEPFIGDNKNHQNYWGYGESGGNNWNNNFMPGFEAMYGYNCVNVSHFNNETKKSHLFFEKPVLVNTLYYPAFSNDTLDNRPLTRDFYMLSVYDEDTNKDGFLNRKDLRRLYYFDLNGQNKTALIPEQYSVMSSEYDPANDFMYVYAKRDENNNGLMEYEEATGIFWIDLKNPTNRGVQFQGD